MGVDYYTYVGPYVEVTLELISKQETRCKNKNPEYCPMLVIGQSGDLVVKADTPPYCPSCGVKKKEILCSREVASVQFDPYDSIEEGGINGVLWSNYYMGEGDYTSAGKKYRSMVYIPNVKSKNYFGKTLDKTENLDMTDIDIQQEMSNFQKEFDKELEILKKAYGNLSIRFGIVQWAN